MTRDIRFYNRDERWFADVPETIQSGGTEDDNEMVAGADTWLGMLSDQKEEVTLRISNDELLGEKLDLYSMDENYTGATYLAYEYDGLPVNHPIWLCAVTLFIFSGYPKIIHYKIIK